MSLFLNVLLLALASSTQALAPFRREAGYEVIPEDYLVVFNHKARVDVSALMDDTMSQFGVSRTPLGSVKMSHCQRQPRQGGLPTDCAGKIDLGSFMALAVTVKGDDPTAILALRSLPNVLYVEQSGKVYGSQSGTCQNQYTTTLWGLDQLDGSNNNYFNHDSNGGSGTDIYILDTGVYYQHSDFGSRMLWGQTFCQNDGAPCVDRQDVAGHGTHVAGSALGSTYGVAKGARGYSVKVLNDANWGSWTGIISGINWSVQNAKSTGRPSIINMSISGGRYTSADNAANSAVQQGVTTVIAAGNDNRDACQNSPAASTLSITVGNHNRYNTRRFDSNYGSCVDIWGPGDGIISCSNRGGTTTMSGTSMSSPHVAGAAAVYLALNKNATPAQVESYLRSRSVTGLTDIKPGSPDRRMILPCPAN